MQVHSRKDWTDLVQDRSEKDRTSEWCRKVTAEISCWFVGLGSKTSQTWFILSCEQTSVSLHKGDIEGPCVCEQDRCRGKGVFKSRNILSGRNFGFQQLYSVYDQWCIMVKWEAVSERKAWTAEKPESQDDGIGAQRFSERNGDAILPDRMAIDDREKGMPINATSWELWYDCSCRRRNEIESDVSRRKRTTWQKEMGEKLPRTDATFMVDWLQKSWRSLVEW